MKATSLYFLSICIIFLLTSCTTQNTTPIVSKTQVPSGCNSAGETHSEVTPGAIPATDGDWPMFRGNLSRSSAGMGNGGKLTLAWTYCTGSAIYSSPVAHNGLLYIASTNNTITALHAQDGAFAWQVQTSDGFFSSPIVQNGTLYACSLNGTIYAIDAQYGFVRWQTHLNISGARIWSSPALANGLLLVGIASNLNEQPKIAGRVLALDATTGKQRWQADILTQGQSGGGVWSSPAIDVTRQRVYVGTGDPDDGVQAFDLSSGRLLWHWRSVIQDTHDTDVGSGPTLYTDVQGQQHVVVGGKDGRIYNLDAVTGHVLWHTQVGNQIYSSPAFANHALYVVGVSGRNSSSMALDAQTGKVLWRYNIAMIVYASPAIVGQTLYLPIGNGFGPGEGGVEVLNAKTGTQIQFFAAHSTMSSSPALLSSWLYVGAQNGNLYAFTH